MEVEMPTTLEKIESPWRKDFPLLAQKIRGKGFAYLDSAATALKPWPVIERISQFYTFETANIHRGAHYLADQATIAFEKTREDVQTFLNAETSAEIIFTKGATDSINLVAHSYALNHLKLGDEILLSEMEHHANIVPWQVAAQKTGAEIKVIPITDAGEIDFGRLQRLLSKKTKIVAIAHASNVLGTVNDIRQICTLAHGVGAVVVVDGAQMVANHPVDVRDLGCDFYAFSAHKFFGPYGSGVLYINQKHFDDLTPYQLGGSMIQEVDLVKGTTFQKLPHMLEAGTPHIEGVLATQAALAYVRGISFASIEGHEGALLRQAESALGEIEGLRIFGQAKTKLSIVSFGVRGCHASDVAQILDQENVAVRAGHLCAQPLMKRFGVTGMIRASFSIYNNTADIERLTVAIRKAQKMLTA